MNTVTCTNNLLKTILTHVYLRRHLGNVLVKSTTRRDIRIDSKTKIETAGLICAIIDFSLSRLENSENQALYHDLSQESWLFHGDADVSDQYEVYRKMKGIVGEDWSRFKPKTNVAWLEHILTALLSKLPVSKRKGPVFAQLDSYLSVLSQAESVQEFLKHF